jgi:hypothetical protein
MPAVKLPTLINTLSIPSNYSLQVQGTTQSLLGDWQTCRKRWLYEINRFSSPEIMLKTQYGDMNHCVLERLYDDFRLGYIKYGDFIDVITETIAGYKFSKMWTEHGAEIARAKAQAVMENYIVYYKRDFDEMRLEQPEREFEIDWRGFIIRGKIDGNFRDKNGGGWNFEHKNYSWINEDLMCLTLSFDLQNLFYIIADRTEYHRVLKGTLYNILRNPTVRKKDGGPAEVYKKLVEDIRKDPKHYFIRYEIPYTPVMISEFEGELYEKLSELQSVMLCPKDLHFCKCYKNEHACERPYRCDFINACATRTMIGYAKNPILFPELKKYKKSNC